MATITSNGPQGMGGGGCRWGVAGVLCVSREEDGEEEGVAAGGRPTVHVVQHGRRDGCYCWAAQHNWFAWWGGGVVGGLGEEMSFFKRKSRLQPNDFTRKSPIVQYLAGTATLMKSGSPPLNPGVGPAFSLSAALVRPSVRLSVRVFYFSASLCPPLPPQRGKIKSDSSILFFPRPVCPPLPLPPWLE